MTVTKRLLLLLGVVCCCAAVAMAQVPPTSIFQLNGKADNSSLTCTYGAPCDYWNLLNGTGNNISGGGIGAGSSAGQSSVRTFINGTSSTFGFQGGGSKDPNLISQWSYSVTGSPNKDTIDAAYAAAYQLGGHFELIFGADRLSPNGDANIGIWFFQNNVGPNGSGGFTGSHQQHDVFVISAFTGGGGTATVTVLEWDQPGQPAGNVGCPSGVKNPKAGDCADSNLRLLAVPTGVCGTSIYCGITNAAATTSTWEGSLASPLFFEGGVDLTAAFAAVGVTQLPCFSSFLVETRSSQAPSSVLKDFLAGGFPVCGLSIDKTCGVATVNGDTSIDYPVTGHVKNTGVGTLYNVTVFDTPTSPALATRTRTVSNNTGTAQTNPNFGTNTLAAGDTGTWSNTTNTTLPEADDKAYAQGGLSSGTTPNGNCAPDAPASCVPQANTVTSKTNATAQCTSSFSTTLAVTKSCGIPSATPTPGVVLTVSGTTVGLSVNVSGTVCNNGVSQVTGVVLTDSPASGAASTINIGTLDGCTGALDANGLCTAPATACKTYSSTYTPTNIDVITTNSTGTGRYFWNDLIKITSAAADFGSLCTINSTGCPTGPTACTGTYGCASQSCPLCQGSGECTTQ